MVDDLLTKGGFDLLTFLKFGKNNFFHIFPALNFKERCSGWSVSHIRSMEVTVAKTIRRGGGGSRNYSRKIDMDGQPNTISTAIMGSYNAHGVRNIADMEGECLKSVICYSLFKSIIKKQFRSQVRHIL